MIYHNKRRCFWNTLYLLANIYVLRSIFMTLSQERNVDIRLRFCRSSRLSWDCIKVLQQLTPRMICAFAAEENKKKIRDTREREEKRKDLHRLCARKFCEYFVVLLFSISASVKPRCDIFSFFSGALAYKCNTKSFLSRVRGPCSIGSQVENRRSLYHEYIKTYL